MGERGKRRFRFERVLIFAVAVLFASECLAIDHALMIPEYKGPQTCEQCHPGMIEQVQQTVHYKFESSVPENYLFDEEGNPREINRSGKLWKLCGFPTTMPQFNWMGSLKDSPDTPHIDKPGGCGRCHIGIGMKPFTAVGKTEVQDNEASNVDCLVCHAQNYSRKFYVATQNGEPELNASGSATVLAVPKVDGVINWSVQLAAAQSVGRTSADTCNRCHASAGGGKVSLDNMEYSFKRGSIYSPEMDVHAKAGKSCSYCHSAGQHKTQRPANNDIYAYDNLVDHQMCTDCHTEEPHGDDMIGRMYNQHVDAISCTGCHATSVGGAVYKDFADVIAPDPSDPLGLYDVRVDQSGDDFQLEFGWFNGQVQGEIEPRGSRGDGKIYPYKRTWFNQPVDADGHPVPVKWGIIFLKGDVPAAANSGRDLYAAMYSDELAKETGIPVVSGAFDHYSEHSCVFSISHGITKDQALTCKCCHNPNPILNFAALGYSQEEEDWLTSMNFNVECKRTGASTQIGNWSIFE